MKPETISIPLSKTVTSICEKKLSQLSSSQQATDSMTKRILIIDDEERVSRVIQLTLKITAAWEVLTATSGYEGLIKAEIEQPDVILLDLMMPDIDGLATLAELRKNPATRQIPVILLTAKIQVMPQNQLAELGVLAVLVKPFDPIKLATQIAQICSWQL